MEPPSMAGPLLSLFGATSAPLASDSVSQAWNTAGEWQSTATLESWIADASTVAGLEPTGAAPYPATLQAQASGLLSPANYEPHMFGSPEPTAGAAQPLLAADVGASDFGAATLQHALLSRPVGVSPALTPEMDISLVPLASQPADAGYSWLPQPSSFSQGVQPVRPLSTLSLSRAMFGAVDDAVQQTEIHLWPCEGTVAVPAESSAWAPLPNTTSTSNMALLSMDPQWGADAGPTQASSQHLGAAAPMSLTTEIEQYNYLLTLPLPAAPHNTQDSGIFAAQPQCLLAPQSPQEHRATARIPSSPPVIGSRDMRGAPGLAVKQAAAAPVTRCSAPTKRSGGCKRHTLSAEMKRRYYQWVVNNFQHPYPKEKDRMDLTGGQVSKQHFKWWFSNFRSRNLEPRFNEEGNRYFVPRPSFIRTCIRYKIEIPWSLPESSCPRAKRQ